MTSRLDRLFVLLDQGTSPLIRKAAATQLGEIQKLHPNEFDTLLVRLKKYLYSNSWDTRIAANEAIEQIIKNIDWTVDDHQSASTNTELPNFNQHPAVIELNERRFCSENYSLEAVIANGQNLFASQEHSDTSATPINVTDQQIAFSRLGLSRPDVLKLTKDETISNDEDLKRKRSTFTDDDHSNKKIKLENDDIQSVNNLHKLNEGEWPLLSFANELKTDLFNVKWEIRHGSAIALRDLIKFHGKKCWPYHKSILRPNG